MTLHFLPSPAWARLAGAAALLLIAARASASDGLSGASLTWFTHDGGGAMRLTGGPYSLSFTIGQPESGPPRVSGVYRLTPGFWGAAGGFSWCAGDFNLDGIVDSQDLGELLADWSTPGPGDLDGSGVVDGPDLGLLLTAWGPCP